MIETIAIAASISDGLAIVAIVALSFLIRDGIKAERAALEAETQATRNQLSAEDARDEEMTRRVKAEAELAARNALIAKLEAELDYANGKLASARAQEIDHASGDDLVTASHRVLGKDPSVPASGGTGGAGTGGGAAEAAPVLDPGAASGR